MRMGCAERAGGIASGAHFFRPRQLMSGVVPRHRFAERARAQRHTRIHHSHPSGELRPLHPMPGLEVLFSFFS